MLSAMNGDQANGILDEKIWFFARLLSAQLKSRYEPTEKKI